MEKFVAICSSARTSPHNIWFDLSDSYGGKMINCYMDSFLEGPKAALKAGRDYNDGHYSSPPQAGIRAFARAYCAWAYGQTVRERS